MPSSSNTNAQQLSTSDLPPLYTTGTSSSSGSSSGPHQSQGQSHTQPPFYSPTNLEHNQDAPGAHWSPYESTVNLSQQQPHPEQQHHGRFHMGLTGTDHHHKDKPSLSIILDKPFLILKGTGPDVEPTTLSGHVLLFLTEATALKELTLQFRGKARIPMPANESLINSATSITYVVCNHDWSFLESTSSSSKRHSRTLKAGKHYFPFSLSIGGSLPSSISSPALGGASVAYKLRAVAVRPGFAHNLQCIQPTPIVRSFTPEALEYQQTLEIENTWPEKLMYAIMLPHKAWAAGDAVGAVLKFCPLGKGVRVVSVVCALSEITKVYARSGAQEDTRTVCSARYEMAPGGRVVEVEYAAGMLMGGAAHAAAVAAGAGAGASSGRDRDHGEGSSHGGGIGLAFSNLAHMVSTHNPASSSRKSSTEDEDEHAGEEVYENHDIVTYIKLRLPYSSAPSPTPPGGHSPASASGYATPSGTGASTPTTPASSSMNFTTTAPSTVFTGPHFASTSTPLPSTLMPNVLVTPSHTLEPITVSHRVRWSIYIRNRDGHISELRCSLPVVILDGRLKSDARDASLLSRRMMAQSCGIVPERGDEELWGMGGGSHAEGGEVGGEGAEGGSGQEGDMQLPSYTAHVRDRVANMFLPEAVTMRVSNPWLGRVSAGGGGSPSASTPPPAAGDSPDLTTTSSVTATATANASDEHLAEPVTGSGSGSDTRRNSSYANLDSAQQQQHPHHPSSHHVHHHHAHTMSHLPHVPASGTSTPLEWVNSELLLSLGDDSLRRFGVDSGAAPGSAGAHPSSAIVGAGAGAAGGVGGVGVGGDGTMTPLTPAAGMLTPPPSLQYVSSGPASRAGSRWGSRAGSRTSSPERSGSGGDHHPHPHLHRRQQSGDLLHQVHQHHSHPQHTEQRISRPGSPTFGGSGSGNASPHVHAPNPAALGYVYEPLPSALASVSSTHSSGSGVHSPLSPHQHQHQHQHVHPIQDHAHVHAHAHSHGHGRLGSFFKATMKPFTALSGHNKHRHDESKEGSGSGSTPNSREGSPTNGGREQERDHFELDHDHTSHSHSASASSSSFHTSQPDLSIPRSAASVEGGHARSSSSAVLPPLTLTTSRSTSNLLAIRRAATQAQVQAGSTSSRFSAESRSQSRPILSTSTSTSTAPVNQTQTLLQRALIEVPDYAIASRGFLGGVPPLTSTRGLPSYEEAVAHAHASANAHVNTAGSAATGTSGDTTTSSTTAGAETGSGTSTASTSTSQGTAANVHAGPSSLSRSEPDIPNRFKVALSATTPVVAPHTQASPGQGAAGGDQEREGEGEDDHDEGIQMRPSRTSTSTGARGA